MDWYQVTIKRNPNASQPSHAVAKSETALRKYLQDPEWYGMFMVMLSFKSLQPLGKDKTDKRKTQVDALLKRFLKSFNDLVHDIAEEYNTLNPK